MKAQPLIFGEVRIPRTRGSLSGSYTCISWSKIKKHATIKICPPSYGNPLLEEKGSKGYSLGPDKDKK